MFFNNPAIVEVWEDSLSDDNECWVGVIPHLFYGSSKSNNLPEASISRCLLPVVLALFWAVL